MAKLALFLATFAFILLVAANATLRATVMIDDEEKPSGESCQQQCQQQDQLSHCQMYMREQSQGGRGGRGRGGGWDNQQEQLNDCCRQMQQMDSRCRCQCLEQAARRMQQQGPYGGEEVYETASELPRMCNIQPMRGCEFRMPYGTV